MLVSKSSTLSIVLLTSSVLKHAVFFKTSTNVRRVNTSVKRMKTASIPTVLTFVSVNLDSKRKTKVVKVIVLNVVVNRPFA